MPPARMTPDRVGDPAITLVRLRLPNYTHSAAFRELEETTLHGLNRAGYRVTNAFAPTENLPRTIVFGAHLLQDAPPWPSTAIIYNTEHNASAAMRPDYLDLLRRHIVWDYSADNAAALAARLGKPVLHVPLGYTPELATIQAADEDIDVLFYGSLNDRRQRVLADLAAAGLRVEAPFGLYGAARDALIARAKIVLNVHFYVPGHFEVIRVGHLMANRKAVVTELNPGETIDPDLAPGLACVPYDDLVPAIRALIADPDRRARLAAAGHTSFAARDAAAILAQAIASSWNMPPPIPPAPPIPRLPGRIVIGSGKSFDPEALNIDLDPRWHPDIATDITQPDLFERTFETTRFGALSLPRDHFEAITVSHVLEHLHDLVTAMTNCLALLAPGGLMHIAVPYDLSYGAWQDPTHVRAFNERSWWYYCDWYWYLGWTDSRFDLIAQDFIASPIGETLRTRGTPEDEILRTPRAIDEIRVVLRKRTLTAAERTHGEAMRGDARA